MKIGSLGLLLAASVLTVGAISASGRSEVVLVEPIVHPGGVVSGYRLVKLSGKEDTPRTLATSKDPLEPLACNAARVIFLDQEGKIWRVPVGGGDAVLLATTQFVPKEDLVGKTVLDLDNRALFAVINSRPEKTARWSGHEFSVVKYSFDGKQTRIGNGDGKAMVLWQVSEDVLEVVSSKEVVDFDPRGERAVSRTTGAPEDLAKAALVTSSLSVFADISAIQVKSGLAGPLVAEFKAKEGFRVVSDIDPAARKVLSIFLNKDMNGARIDELDVSTGEVRERYASAGIGTARFCEK